MNSVKIEYFNEQSNIWEDLTPFVVMPFKISQLLDERLDEAELQLQFISNEIFEPLTKFKVTIVNSPEAKFTLSEYSNKIYAKSDYVQTDFTNIYDENKNQITQKREILMLVANDSATERPIGSGKYNHQIYLIEFTKFLEGFIGDSLTFTNALGTNFVKDAPFIEFYIEQLYSAEYVQNSFYKSFYSVNTKLQLETNIGKFIRTQAGIGAFLDNELSGFAGIYITDENGNNIYKQYFYGSELKQKIGSESETVLVSNIGLTATIPWQPYELNLNKLGFFKIEYKTGSMESGSYVRATSDFYVVENNLPIKKWTIADVICRTLETIEVLRGFNKGKSLPRFKLQGVVYYKESNGLIKRDYQIGSLAENLNKILAPEFIFTKMTLREMLQQIGGFIHAEPRISGLIEETFFDNSVPHSDFEKRQFYEIVFDDYGQTTKTYLENTNYPYLTKEENININEYCTNLDSSVDNLVSALDFAQGVTIEPFKGQYKTVKAVSSAVKFEENDNCIIETSRPIYEIGLQEQLICNYDGTDYDLTPFVFSLTEYQNLSSFKGAFPYVKAYALYYVHGEKNIRGLFFKNPSAGSGFWQKYAISNILSSVTGKNIDLDISTLISKCKFQIKYNPYNKERIKTTKPIVRLGLPRTLAYNQGANAVETRYLGEHLKGLILRLGNVEKSITYMFSFLSEIPKVGLKYDDNYYISAVTTEVLPTCLKCTIGLSKNFNRQSEYISLNSEKRMWEISEKQTTERETVITDYVYLQARETISPLTNNEDVLYNNSLNIVYELLNLDQGGTQRQVISAASFIPYSKSLNNLINDGAIVLPVISTAYGNSLVFNCKFEDNYSAGQSIIQKGAIYYSNYVRYTDYWGRVYSFDFYLSDANADNSYSNIATNLPYAPSPIGPIVFRGNINNNNTICYQKDNREVPDISYELQFVSDGKIIIGSALASNCRLVNSSPSEWEFVLLKKELSLVDNGKINASDIEATIQLNPIVINANVLSLPRSSNIDHKAWAFITKITEETIEVADEDGNAITQTIYKGGELLFGQNKKLETQTYICFQLKSDIYKKF